MNFTSFSETSIFVRFIADEPKLIKNLSLIPENKESLISCKDYYKMKLCNFTNFYFEKDNSGIYNTYHLNHKSTYSCYYDSSPIKITLSYEAIDIDIKDRYNKKIGVNGRMYLRTDYNDEDKNIFNDSNIEENTKFSNNIIYDETESSIVDCNLWKTFEGIIFIFCKFRINLSIGYHRLNFAYNSFIYNEKYKIYLHYKFASNYVGVEQFDIPLPFLYSNDQTIEIEDEKDKYYLKFRLLDYQNEKIVLKSSNYYERFTNLFLNKCSIEQKELICEVEKTEFEEAGISQLDLYFFIPSMDESEVYFSLNTIGIINVNYALPKIDVKVQIKKLMDNHIDKYNFITYETETDVKNISNIMTKPFELNFNEGTLYTNGIYSLCYLKKKGENPLYLLCSTDEVDAREDEDLYLVLEELWDEEVLEK